MSIPIYTSADFDTPRVINSQITYPFSNEDDVVTKQYDYMCAVRKSEYVPIALDVTMTTAAIADVIELPYVDAAAYHVGDYDHVVSDDDLMTFRRSFSQIPATRDSVVTAPMSYTFPGVTSGNLNNATQSAVSSVSYSSTTGQLTINCASNIVGLTAGDTIFLELTTTQTIGTEEVTFNYSKYRVASVFNNAAQVKVLHPAITGTLKKGKVYVLTEQGEAMHATVAGTITKFEYFLPGVTTGITTPSNVLPSPIFSPFSTFTGETVIALSDTTVPTATSYKASVAANEQLTIDSRITKYIGNIIQKADKKVIAI